MLLKILGLILIIFGGITTLGVLFPLIGSALGFVVLLVKLAIGVVILYFGYRLVTRDRDAY